MFKHVDLFIFQMKIEQGWASPTPWQNDSYQNNHEKPEWIFLLIYQNQNMLTHSCDYLNVFHADMAVRSWLVYEMKQKLEDE